MEMSLEECMAWCTANVEAIADAEDAGDTDALEIIRISEYIRATELTPMAAIRFITSVQQLRDKLEAKG